MEFLDCLNWALWLFDIPWACGLYDEFKERMKKWTASVERVAQKN